MILRADILTPEGIVTNGIVEYDESGVITDIAPYDGQATDLDFPGALAVPGFVDLHVHGGGGSDFMDGSIEAVRCVLRTHATFGTTSLLATTLTASGPDIDRAILSIVNVVEAPERGESTIRGIHLEGPYICKNRRGAQPEGPIRPPACEELEHWQTISGGRIKQITMAPELPGAVEFISYAVSCGITVSLGHTEATSDQVLAAIDAGARQGTHLFNAMSPLTHRAPGAVGALLSSDRVFCELICDGVHVDPVAVQVAVRAKGTEKILLITDAMSGAAMPDGEYALGGQQVIVRDGAAKFIDGTLAGSVLTMNKAFSNIMAFTEVSATSASRMSSYNASSMIGIDDIAGTIKTGKIADIAVIDTSNWGVLATLKSGLIAFRR